MQVSVALFHTPERSQLEPSPTVVRYRREFIDLRTLMLLRALAGPRASRQRRLVFMQKGRSSALMNPCNDTDNRKLKAMQQ